MDINNIISQLHAYRTIKDINDAISNGLFSKDAAKMLQEYFAQYDLNSDGTISADEYSYWSRFAEFSDEQGLDTPASDDNATEAPSTPQNGTPIATPTPTETPKEGEPTPVNNPDGTDETAPRANKQSADKPDVQKDLEGNIITYPKSGENFKMTAKRLGFKEGTPEFEEFVKANEQAAKRNYFIVGQEVKIPPTIQAKANLSKAVSKEQNKAEVSQYRATHPTSNTATKNTQQNKKYPVAVNEFIKKLEDKNAQFVVKQEQNGNYKISVSKNDFLKRNNAYAVDLVYDKSGKLVSRTVMYNDGKKEEITYKNGVDGIKKTWPAAPKAYQAYAEKCQKRDGGDYHLEFNTESKKWVLVQKFDNKEVRRTLQMKTTKNTATNKKTVSVSANSKPKAKAAVKTPSKNTVNNAVTKSNLDYLQRIPGFEHVDLSYDNKKRISYPNDAKYPEPIRNCLATLRGGGAEVEVTQNKNGNYSVTISRKNEYNPAYFMPQAISDNARYGSFICTTVTFDEKGNMLEAKQKFTGGETTTQFRHEIQTGTRKTVQYKDKVSYSAQSAIDRNFDDHIPIDITIELPEHYKNNKNAIAFSKSITNNKAQLMKMFGITNEEYDELASIAMGIAEQETHFGQIRYQDTKGNKHTNMRYAKKELAASTGALYGSNHSWGITQIDWYANFEKDKDKEPAKTLRKQAAEFGITSFENYKNNPQRAAILTMILLNNKRIWVKDKEWQKRLENNNNMIDNDNTLTQEQKAEKKLTTADLIALNWNGITGVMHRLDDPNQYVTIDDNNSGAVNKDGDKIKDGTSYARNVRAYRKKFFKVKQDANSRNKVMALSRESQENSGKIGTVLFMPTAFAGSQKATKTDIELLESVLKNKTGIDNTKKEELLDALRNGYFSFGYGLTKDEAESITANDVDRILQKVNKVKEFTQDNNSPADIRNYAKQIQDEFRSEYLQSRQVVVNISDVNRNTVLSALRYQEDIDERLVANRDAHVTDAHLGNKVQGRANAVIQAIDGAEASGIRYGFRAERDKGVNPYDANGNLVPDRQRVLAENASTVAQAMSTGGQCLTGVKLSFENSGIIQKGELVYPKGHKDAGKPITTPRDAVLYFNAHPEKFTRVKYVYTGNGQARELNASDIRNLPAGYVGIYIPGEGYDDQAGHAFITNGNSQGYSDETDNLRWDDFKSNGAGNGKGEHGHYVIYKLTDGWQVDPATGKLVFKG